MNGRRVYPDAKGALTLEPGDYGRIEGGAWYAKIPTGREVRLGVVNHKVVEHEDGTITVSPSIVWDSSLDPENPNMWWHGFLERGVWRSV